MQTRASVRLWKSESRSGVISNMTEQYRSGSSTRSLRVLHGWHDRATSTSKLPYLSLPLAILLIAQALTPLSFGQRRVSRNGAHSSAEPEAFTAADRRLVERAIGQTCAERTRDPFSSMAIDEMQARPSLPVGHPDAVAGLRRAERVLPTTRRLVTSTIVELAKEYDLYGTTGARSRVDAATARVEAVRRVKPDVDSRDNASVLLREPRTIEFGTIFLAGLRSDEAMISVLAHELTHIASGQADSLRPLFRAIARRAAARTGLRIQGQRAEELSCDLVGLMAARQFIKETPSWEPLPRRLARAVEHNCVDDDASDDDHLSPRNTIRALFALDVSLASEVLTEGTAGGLMLPQPGFSRSEFNL
ncbi:MAG: hypothetical protein QOH42_832 [Blastocatellia bacterium]|nr:hypothetical protein [Blastocatellia bacterium]